MTWGTESDIFQHQEMDDILSAQNLTARIHVVG
jgi:hypothetical protein